MVLPILGKKHLQNGKDFGRCVCIIKKPGGLPRWAVLPAFSLPVFNFFITNKTKDRRVAVCPGIRNPRFAPGFLRICCYAAAQSFSNAAGGI